MYNQINLTRSARLSTKSPKCLAAWNISYRGGFRPSIEGLHIFTAPGQIDSTPLTPSNSAPYFSISGGILNMGFIGDQFNQGGGDIADWTNSKLVDSFGYANYGKVEPVSVVDQVQMATLGWDWSFF